jgi:histone acetyltransferase (RNA polymerase elongator complex component)
MEKQKKNQNKWQPKWLLRLFRKKDETLKIDLEKTLGLDIPKDNTYIIPIFIPHRGCKNECVFCNQRKISGELRDVKPEDVRNEIQKFLELYKDETREKQIAFFGGSFTGIDIKLQEEYLAVANEYISKGLVKNIRISTRPDYIDENILSFLKKYNVKIIELGVQSMADDVLLASKRGHTAEDVIKASKLIKSYGFTLGHQIMVGLPQSTEEKEIYTIQQVIDLKPSILRIYPVYVLKDSKLYDMAKDLEYIPLTLKEAVKRTAKIYKIAIEANINVIRIGLQTTEEINSKNTEILGPVCDNYRERILSYISKEELEALILKKI